MQLTAEHPVQITNPDKLLWPEAGITKLEYIRYLVDVSPWLLPHLREKPLTVIRFPNGVNDASFYQKDLPQGAPDWVTTTPIWSPDREDHIHYILVDSVATLMWLGNLASLEFHVGFTTVMAPDLPTAVAFDLDPTAPGFEPVREVGMALHDILSRLELPHVAKTSGATGIQVFIPLQRGPTFDETRLFTETVAKYLEASLPKVVTLERLKKNRGEKVYVDYLQHGQGRTLIAPYSPRARREATVSTPIFWHELEEGCVPEDFTLPKTPLRLQQHGDLLNSASPVDLGPLLQFLARRGPTALL